jgi:hypothetical protein
MHRVSRADVHRAVERILSAIPEIKDAGVLEEAADHRNNSRGYCAVDERRF